MPKSKWGKVERALAKSARKHGYGEKKSGAYTFGTLRKLGWKPSKKGK